MARRAWWWCGCALQMRSPAVLSLHPPATGTAAVMPLPPPRPPPPPPPLQQLGLPPSSLLQKRAKPCPYNRCCSRRHGGAGAAAAAALRVARRAFPRHDAPRRLVRGPRRCSLQGKGGHRGFLWCPRSRGRTFQGSSYSRGCRQSSSTGKGTAGEGGGRERAKWGRRDKCVVEILVIIEGPAVLTRENLAYNTDCCRATMGQESNDRIRGFVDQEC